MWSLKSPRTTAVNLDEEIERIMLGELTPAIDKILRIAMEDYDVSALELLVELAKLKPEKEGIVLKPFPIDTPSQHGLIFIAPTLHRNTPLHLRFGTSNKTARQQAIALNSVHDLFYLTLKSSEGSPHAERFRWLDDPANGAYYYFVAALKYFLIFNNIALPLSNIEIKMLNKILGIELDARNIVASIRSIPFPKSIEAFIEKLCGKEPARDKVENLYKCLECITLAYSIPPVIKFIKYKLGQGESIQNPWKALNLKQIFESVEYAFTYQKRFIEERIAHYNRTFSSPMENIEAKDKLAYWQKTLKMLSDNMAKFLEYKTHLNKFEQTKAFKDAMSDEPKLLGRRGSSTEEAGGSGGAASGAPAVQLVLEPEAENSPQNFAEAMKATKKQIIDLLRTIAQYRDPSKLFRTVLFREEDFRFAVPFDLDASRSQRGVVVAFNRFKGIQSSIVLRFEHLADVLFGPHTDLGTHNRTEGVHPKIAVFLARLEAVLHFYLKTKDPLVPKLSAEEIDLVSPFFLRQDFHNIQAVIDLIIPPSASATQLEQVKSLWNLLSTYSSLEQFAKLLLQIDALPASPDPSNLHEGIYALYNINGIVEQTIHLVIEQLSSIQTEAASLSDAIGRSIDHIKKNLTEKKAVIISEVQSTDYVAGDEATRLKMKADKLAEAEQAIARAPEYLAQLERFKANPIDFNPPADKLKILITGEMAQIIKDLEVDIARLKKLHADARLLDTNKNELITSQSNLFVKHRQSARPALAVAQASASSGGAAGTTATAERSL